MDVSTFLTTLLGEGGLAMVVSGWISAHLTNATDKKMVLQTAIVAVVITFLSSVTGVIPVPVTEVWAWTRQVILDAAASMLLYKSGILNSVLAAIKARTQHQITASST